MASGEEVLRARTATYTRDAAENVLLGCPELRPLVDTGIISFVHPHNAVYPFRTTVEVIKEQAYSFDSNVPWAGYKFAYTPTTHRDGSGVHVPFNESGSVAYHGTGRVAAMVDVARNGLRPTPPGMGCVGKIFVTPSMTLAWHYYGARVEQIFQGERQTWSLLFQCRVIESAAKVTEDTTTAELVGEVSRKLNFTPLHPGSVDPVRRRSELEWVFEDPSKLHTHAIILMPFPFSESGGPHHNSIGSMRMPQGLSSVCVRLPTPLPAGCTTSAIQHAFQEEARRLRCGIITVSALLAPNGQFLITLGSNLAARIFLLTAGKLCSGGNRVIMVGGVEAALPSA